MKLRKERQDLVLDWNSGEIRMWQRITQFFNPKQYNWLDFDFIKVMFEIDKMHGCFEIELALFGLYFRFMQSYPSKRAEANFKRYAKSLKTLNNGGIHTFEGEK